MTTSRDMTNKASLLIWKPLGLDSKKGQSNRDSFEASQAFNYSLWRLCQCLWNVLLPLNLTEGSTQETEHIEALRGLRQMMGPHGVTPSLMVSSVSERSHP